MADSSKLFISSSFPASADLYYPCTTNWLDYEGWFVPRWGNASQWEQELSIYTLKGFRRTLDTLATCNHRCWWSCATKVSPSGWMWGAQNEHHTVVVTRGFLFFTKRGLLWSIKGAECLINFQLKNLFPIESVLI